MSTPMAKLHQQQQQRQQPGTPTTAASAGEKKSVAFGASSSSHPKDIDEMSRGASVSNSMTASRTSKASRTPSRKSAGGSFGSASGSVRSNSGNVSSALSKEDERLRRLIGPSAGLGKSSWLDMRTSAVKNVQSAASSAALKGKTSSELDEAIKYVQTENSMMEEVLSEPHHIVSNNDLALIMKSMLSAASDSKSSSILQGRKPPVLRSVIKARGEKPPPDRSGTEYLPFASSAVPYRALQQEQRDMMQRNKEREVVYKQMVLDVERQQHSLQDQWS